VIRADGMRAVLFRSKERFNSFQEKLSEYGVECIVLDFQDHDWIDFDYSGVDMIIYYPSFTFSSNHPLALHEVYDNMEAIRREYPDIQCYPDPKLFRYYNDKYAQLLFLKKHKYPMPETVPLLSDRSLDLAEEGLGYPMVVKNRFGAGGEYVFKVSNRKELEKYHRLSRLDLFRVDSFRHLFKTIARRIFLYHLIKARQAPYLFLSPPLLAQKFIRASRDLKIVVGAGEVVEGHWRYGANEAMWKMNIDGGGVGEWSYIPKAALDLAIRLAEGLQASWINLDVMECDGEFLITEFSPVWHHYAYKEKPSFVYKDDYNLGVPLEVSLDLERIIVESLVRMAQGKREASLG